MGKTIYHLAIDLGASGGRHMLGHYSGGKLIAEEVYRFDNGCILRNGSLVWDTEHIFAQIIKGMVRCAELGKAPVSMAIDTWGVDYALLDKDGALIEPVYAYRDGRTLPFTDTVVPFEEMYRVTGTQFQTFTTVYQLLADKASGRLNKAEGMLMIPEYFSYLLTGVRAREYTNASTTGLLNAVNRDWDYSLINKLGLKEELFDKVSEPGFCIGGLRDEVAQQAGFDCRVIMTASHDTAAAVNTVPADAMFISSGTWSLLGTLGQPVLDDMARAANYASEGAMFGRVRLLKNIMGLWIIQQVRAEDGKRYSYAELAGMAEQEAVFDWDIDLNRTEFFSPESMIAAIDNECVRTGQPVPATIGQRAHLIFNSLAKCYRRAAAELESVTGKTFDAIHIIGGGSNNNYLNRLTARQTGRKVYAGPAEATAAGNLLGQLYALKIIGAEVPERDVQQVFYDITTKSFEIKEIQ